MEGDNHLLHELIWYPFSFLGIEHTLTGLNIHIIFHTWFVLAILLIFSLLARIFLLKEKSFGQYLIKKFALNFTSMVEQSADSLIERHYLFIASLFTYILSCNWLGLFPYVEEPTKDINTTLALGIIVFVYIHKEVIYSLGLKHFLKDLFMPFEIFFPLNLIAGLFMLPLKLLGELATVISLSFRLFGNIFGGYIISTIYYKALSGSILFQIIGLLSGVNLLIAVFFILFEGFLQAFVFSILSLTNTIMAIKTEEKGIL